MNLRHLVLSLIHFFTNLEGRLSFYRPHPKDREGTVFTGMCLPTVGVPHGLWSQVPFPSQALSLVRVSLFCHWSCLGGTQHRTGGTPSSARTGRRGVTLPQTTRTVVSCCGLFCLLVTSARGFKSKVNSIVCIICYLCMIGTSTQIHLLSKPGGFNKFSCREITISCR